MKQNLIVLGAGESGVGAAVLGQKEGYRVFVSDRGKIHEKFKEVLLHYQIDWEENQHSENRIFEADLVVKSPGIPDSIPLIEKIRAAGIELISEIEFASRFTSANLIAVTGSNGKTTVVNWIAYILKQAGMSYELAGNVGFSFAAKVALTKPENFVLEVSSFQLDDIENFHPHIAVLTNITPDHLDRYNYDFAQYIDAKFKITMNQTEEDYFIYDADDEVIVSELKKRTIKAQKIPFSFKNLEGDKTEMRNNKMTTTLKDKIFNIPVEHVGLEGEHNAKNAMAASTVAHVLKIRKQTIRESLETFQGVEHRLEKVGKVNNVEYINDSKATNVNSTFYALKTTRPKTIWIAGGVDKGNDYTDLLPLVHEKVKALICLGIDNAKLIQSFNNCIDLIVEVKSMQEAVDVAAHIAESGDTVLLSPACASYDLFENYEIRGEKFKEAVNNL